MNQYQYTALNKAKAPQWLYDKIEAEEKQNEQNNQLKNNSENDLSQKIAADFDKKREE